MYLYKKRSSLKKELAKRGRTIHADKHPCPTCKKSMSLAESNASGDTYICDSCSGVHTYAPLPGTVKNTKETKMHTLTVRDHSKPSKASPALFVDGKRRTGEDIALCIMEIKKAMKELKVLSLEYVNRNNDAFTRLVEPYKLSRDGSGELVFFARSLAEDEVGIRMFKLSRVIKVSIQEYTFRPLWPIEDKIPDETIRK